MTSFLEFFGKRDLKWGLYLKQANMRRNENRNLTSHITLNHCVKNFTK